MPFNSGGQNYVGGSYLYGGLSSLGQGIGAGLHEVRDKIDEQRKVEAYNDEVVKHALKSGQIALEDYAKYRDMSRMQKTGFAAGLAANFMEDFRKEQLASMKESRAASAESRQASAELRRQQANAFNFEPSEEMKALARTTSNEIIQTGPGKWSIVPYGGSGQDQVITDPLTIGGKVIPGIGVNRKTGQYVYFPQDVGGGIKIEVDPQTGTPFYRDIKGNPKPLTGQQIMAGQMMPGNAADTAASTAKGGGVLDTIINGIFNAMGAPGPWQDVGNAAATAGTTLPAPVTGNDVTAAPSPAGDARVRAIAILQQNSKPVTEANIQAVIKKLGGQPGQKLDPDTAREFLQRAGGDKDKARELARAAGYVF